jgi:hypothetical protein
VHHLFNWTTDGDGMGACSSDWVIGLISDHVLLPKDLAPGACKLLHDFMTCPLVQHGRVVARSTL